MIDATIPELDRRSDESFDDYIYRICSMKNDLKATWDDLADFLNAAIGADYSESYYRKRFKKLSATKNIGSEAELKQILFDLKKERVKISDERAQINALARSISRKEYLHELASSIAKEMPDRKYLGGTKPINNQGLKKAILQISDWHYGMSVCNPWNFYNCNIAKERIARLRDRVIQKLHHNQISELYIVNLGDLISGRIHDTIRIQNSIDSIHQTLEVAQILTELIADFSKEFVINYISCSDNHSRLEANKERSLDTESLNIIIDEILKLKIQVLQADNKCKDVHFLDSPYGYDIAKFSVMQYNIAGVHGHKDSPKNIVENMTLATQECHDLLLAAHLHHFSADEKNYAVVVSNGSLMGVDDYAESLRLTNRPSQNLIILSPDNPVDDICRILVDN